MGKTVKVAYELLTLPPEDVDITDKDVEFGEETKVEVGGVRDAVKTLNEIRLHRVQQSGRLLRCGR